MEEKQTKKSSLSPDVARWRFHAPLIFGAITRFQRLSSRSASARIVEHHGCMQNAAQRRQFAADRLDHVFHVGGLGHVGGHRCNLRAAVS